MLFSDDEISSAKTHLSDDERKRLSDQLIRLGDMMGDGLHHEPGGGWINREYKKISRLLYPEIREAEKTQRKMKNDATDQYMAEFLKDKTCPKCSGVLKQTRKGAKTVRCQSCESKFNLKTRKRR